MKMKELETRTGVNRESIRYYIREGLLPPPQKLKRNVAVYGSEHIERTRLIKRLQDEHFLPLKVVKDVLDKISHEASLSQLSRPALSQLLSSLIHDTLDSTPTTAANLVGATGIAREEIDAMAEVGAISVGDKDEVTARDAEIVRLWATARDEGFTAQRGYDVNYLKKYVTLSGQWSVLETQHFLEAFSDTPDEEAAIAAAKGIEISSSLVTLLHTNAVLQMFDELSNLQTPTTP